MGDLKKAKHQNQNRHVKPKKAELTPEQQAEIKAAQEKAAADAKAEQERVELYGKNLEKMSYHQLHQEVKKTIRREHTKVGKGHYEPIAGLTIAYATVLDAMLTNTKSKENPFAKLSHYLNPEKAAGSPASRV